LTEERIVRSGTGFKDSLIWNKLYKFQKDGVMGAIDKLEKYNGCIIADSVGPGKTFTALAVIKYYESRNDRVLVLTPKKLRENWSVYTRNDNLNQFEKDRFRYDVLNHTDLSRYTGKSGDINLETINWQNYDLAVIDEYHIEIVRTFR
jgi:SNF2 family DNA or RNA helicase